jgi:putative endonuclease
MLAQPDCQGKTWAFHFGLVTITLMDWRVYIVLCSDGTLYTGISSDPERRFAQHDGRQGARYFRGRRPVRMVYLEGGHDRGSASRREAVIKKLPRREKLKLLESPRNELAGAAAGTGKRC